jgi:hypothetical protein
MRILRCLAPRQRPLHPQLLQMKHAGDAAPIGTMIPKHKSAVVREISENHCLNSLVNYFVWPQKMVLIFGGAT